MEATEAWPFWNFLLIAHAFKGFDALGTMSHSFILGELNSGGSVERFPSHS